MNMRQERRWHTITGAVILLLAVTIGVTSAMQIRQLFIDTDNDTATGYPGDGSNVVCCLGCPLDHCTSGGWGQEVDCSFEYYNDQGELVERYGGTCNFVCCTGDMDGDGDIDLADFQLFESEWTGPGREQ